MKIIVNCSGLDRGGVIQASYSFLLECIKRENYTFFVFILKSQIETFKPDSFPSNFKFYYFDKRPNNSVISTLRLYLLEQNILPDLVFTPFGPNFWRPRVPHLCGFALPFYVYPESQFFKMHKPTFRFRIEKALKMWLTKYTNDHIYVENYDIKQKLEHFFGFKPEKVHFISGAYNQVFDLPPINRPPFLPPKKNKEFRFVTIAPFFRHKHLIIIKEIVQELKRDGISNIKFVLTLADDIFKKTFSEIEEYTYNVGYIKLEECPVLYSECDATFMPTLLESFTAIYPDSMRMSKPIITTDLGFARTVCGDAALYYQPLSAKDALDKILTLVNNNEIFEELKEKGNLKLCEFPSAEERANKYFEILENMVQKPNKS